MRSSRCILVLLALFAPLTNLQPAVAEVVRPTSNQNATVQRYIEQLGSPGYAQRKSAEDALLQVAPAAIDALLLSQYHSNPEIRIAVRELISRMRLRFSDPEDDDSIVADIVRDYPEQSDRQKVDSAIWLVQLEDGIGLTALMRVVRYEASEEVAKQAALSLLEELDQKDPLQMAAFQTAQRQILATCDRTPALWLSRFAMDSRDATGTGVPNWSELAEAEQRLKDSSRYNPFISAMLHQMWAEDAFRAGNHDSAQEAVQQIIQLRKTSPAMIVETARWLIDQEQHQLFRQLVWEPFEELRTTDPSFAYCNFVSKSRQNDPDAAQKAFDVAFAITENDELFPNAFERAYTRLQVASQLETSGFPDASILEYRRILEMGTSLQTGRVQEGAADYLAEMLHDHQRDQEAADVLEAKSKRPAGRFGRSVNVAASVSRMHYFRSEHFRQNGNRSKQIEFLEKAVEADPQDADVLIAMHRLPRPSKSWEARTSKLIAEAVANFKTELQTLKATGEIQNRSQIATNLNQSAWLISNTEGDFEKAVANSRRSLELNPASAGSLDTLGRAYFSVGDLDNAIRYQRRAVRLQPTSRQIVRQLEEFEAKKASE